jgi:transcriptional regulator with XRE-family HTH domain
MNRFPYSADALKGFEEIEADAMTLQALSEEMEQSASVIEQLENGSRDAVQALRVRAKRLRRVAACLGYVAGRVSRIHLLNEPVRRETSYGRPNYHRSAA